MLSGLIMCADPASAAFDSPEIILFCVLRLSVDQRLINCFTFPDLFFQIAQPRNNTPHGLVNRLKCSQQQRQDLITARQRCRMVKIKD